MVGNGPMDGLTDDQRRTTATLRGIGVSPLYVGDDLTRLDRLGLDLLAKDEVIASDKSGRPAKPVAVGAWHADLGDGSHAVALFNRDKQPAEMAVRWADLGLPTMCDVRDVWARADLGRTDHFTATLPPDGCRLFRVRPAN